MNKKKIEQALRDYRWMINGIKSQRELLNDYNGGNLVAQGGIESALLKGKGSIGDPVAMEVLRRDKSSRWVGNLEKKVLFIQRRLHVIKEPKEKAVLQCMLDGLSMKAIGKHMGLSRTHIYRLKDSIVLQMLHFEQNEHFKHKKHSSTKERSCV